MHARNTAKGVAGFIHIIKLDPHLSHGFRRAINRDVLLLQGGKAADIVEPKNMVGMRMRQENRIDAFDSEAQHLVAKIRRRIEYEVLAFCNDIQTATPPPVFWFGGRTYAA